MSHHLSLHLRDGKIYWRVQYSGRKESTLFGSYTVSADYDGFFNEYLVVWHLLVDRALLGPNQYGDGLKITFSQPLGKKLFMGSVRIDNNDVMQAVTAFRVRFADAKIECNHRPSGFNFDVPAPSLPLTMPEVKARSTSLSQMVNITFHALDRWRERSKTSSYARALQKLIDMISANVFHEVSLNERIAFNKLMKYEVQAVHYSVNVEQGIRFVCVDKPNGEKAMVTVYFTA